MVFDHPRSKINKQLNPEENHSNKLLSMGLCDSFWKCSSWLYEYYFHCNFRGCESACNKIMLFNKMMKSFQNFVDCLGKWFNEIWSVNKHIKLKLKIRKSWIYKINTIILGCQNKIVCLRLQAVQSKQLWAIFGFFLSQGILLIIQTNMDLKRREWKKVKGT